MHWSSKLNGNICWAGKLLFFWCRCGGGDDELFPPNGLIDINGTGFADCESCWDDCVLLWIYGDCGNISGEGGGILNCEPCWLLNKLDDCWLNCCEPCEYMLLLLLLVDCGL